MREVVYIKSDIKEEIREHFSHCEFQDPCKNEIDVTFTPDYVKCEEEAMDIKYKPLDSASCSYVKDEGRPHTGIKTDIKDEYSCDTKNGDFQIVTKVDDDEMNSVNTVRKIKFEEIDIKHEPLDHVRLSSTENGETSVPCKDNLRKNTTTNLRDLKTQVYECNTCLYKTRRKSNLRDHMLVHTDPSKRAKFECNTCLYETPRKGDLQKHILVHTDTSETAKYECNICPFKTHWKSTLRYHLLRHTDPSYECNVCSYKARRKYHLQQHMLVHTDTSETTKFECNTCSYKTRWKSTLRNHMLRHTDPSYECSVCSYKARRKSHLQRHMVIHTSDK